MDTENRFIALETKIAFMDDFINKLQNEVVEQQKLIEILREENKILSSRIMDLSENIEIPNKKQTKKPKRKKILVTKKLKFFIQTKQSA